MRKPTMKASREIAEGLNDRENEISDAIDGEWVDGALHDWLDLKNDPTFNLTEALSVELDDQGYVIEF